MSKLFKSLTFRFRVHIAAFAPVMVFCGSASAQSMVITTFAGNGVHGYSGDGGAATAASLQSPLAMCTDAAGNIYLADVPTVVRKIDNAGIITTVAGNGTAGYAGDGGAASAAQINSPRGLVIDAAGNLYFSEEMNNTVRKVDVAGNISTVVGTGTMGFSGDGGPATAAELRSPGELAMDAAGNLYIADRYNAAIRKVSPAGIITTIAGTPGTLGYSGTGGPASAAAIGGVNGLCFDAAGNLFLAEGTPKSVIRKIGTDGVITHVAGDTSLTSGWVGEGMPATATRLTGSGGIAVDNAGQVYFSESMSNKVRKVDATGMVRAVAGTGTYGFGGDGGSSELAKLKGPTGLMIGPDGALLIADSGNSRVRKVGNAPSSILQAPEHNSLELIPNPCAGHFLISVPRSEKVSCVKITDVTGAVKWQRQYSLETFPRSTEIRVPDVAPGAYLVVVSTQAATYVKVLEISSH